MCGEAGCAEGRAEVMWGERKSGASGRVVRAEDVHLHFVARPCKLVNSILEQLWTVVVANWALQSALPVLYEAPEAQGGDIQGRQCNDGGTQEHTGVSLTSQCLLEGT